MTQQLQDNVPLELVTIDGKKIIIEYSSETKALVVKTPHRELKALLGNYGEN